MAKKIYTFRAIIEPDKPEGFHGFVPTLPGCHTRGDTIEETKENLKEAIAAYLEVALKHGDPIPQNEVIEFTQPVMVEKLKSRQKVIIPTYA